MAKDGVKRGFFFYFGLFILILLGIASVLMIVMMFMPKTSILGIQYFTNSSAIRVDTTTDGEIPIDFDYGSNFNKVEIKTNFANVSIQKNNEFKRNGIYFVNKSRGFVATKKANDFSYSAIIEDNVLKISLEEEKAFLYFSKEIEIVFQISNETVNPLADKTVEIITNSGDVNIGGGYALGESYSLSLKNLNVETDKGSINISNYGANNYANLTLKTGSGDISIAPSSVKAETMSLETESGDISATKLESSGVINFSSNKGKILVSEIAASTDFQIVDTYVKVGIIQGSVDFSRSVGKIKSAVVNISLVGGDLVATEAANADFNLGTVKGNAKIETNGGDINIKDKVFTGWSLKTKTGKIIANLNVNVEDVEISTEKGTLTLDFPRAFSNVIISNKEGKTNLTLSEQGKYKMTFKYYDSDDKFDLSTFDFKNVKLNRGQELKNPLIVGNGVVGESSITLKCNNEINFYWSQSA